MKKIIHKFQFSLVIILLCTNVSFSQMSINAHASAEVIQALTATESAALNFGRFSPESAGGEIKMSPDGTRTSTGSLALGAGLYNPAIFNISGQPDFNVVLNLPTVPVLLTNNANGKTMQVINWESIPESSASGIKIQSSGILTLNVGATLKVGNMNDNPVGLYNGTYAVTFSYN